MFEGSNSSKIKRVSPSGFLLVVVVSFIFIVFLYIFNSDLNSIDLTLFLEVIVLLWILFPFLDPSCSDLDLTLHVSFRLVVFRLVSN